MTANERADALTYLYTGTLWYGLVPDEARPPLTEFYLSYIGQREYSPATLEAARHAAHAYLLGWLGNTRLRYLSHSRLLGSVAEYKSTGNEPAS